MKRTLVLPVLFSALIAASSFNAALAEDHQCKSHVNTCISKCEAAVKHLQKTKGDAKVIQSLKECITACKGHNSKKVTPADCADKCNACATACENAKDPALKDCISECHSCADCCSSQK